ncbi:FixH family protein [Bacillus sp. 03113]|uniref:FixH family protein n=1 Tax=Bacillus sp. 03113 TaxID=2578211 RepID=UPI00114397CC|nr:FixH family protein [Bacillus sp. 03113]
MKKIVISILLSTFLLVACGQNESGQGSSPKPIEVKLNVPKQAGVDQNITISAEITQDQKKVDDAKEVEFEIWKDGKKGDSLTLDANHKGKGIYQTETSLQEEGNYFVQVHVTARSMHAMPKTTIQIGQNVIEEHEHGESDEANHQGEEHHHHEDVAFEFHDLNHYHVNQELNLIVDLKKDGAPLTNAKVRYEILLNGDKTIKWVETNEENAGTYAGKYTFLDKGKYTIKIHVENDEGIHDHYPKEIIVE